MVPRRENAKSIANEILKVQKGQNDVVLCTLVLGSGKEVHNFVKETDRLLLGACALPAQVSEKRQCVNPHPHPKLEVYPTTMDCGSTLA